VKVTALYVIYYLLAVGNIVGIVQAVRYGEFGWGALAVTGLAACGFGLYMTVRW